jgi:hypothetical protein
LATLLVFHVLYTAGQIFYAASVLLALYIEVIGGGGGARAGGIKNWKILCSNEHSSLYNLVNDTNMVHNILSTFCQIYL